MSSRLGRAGNQTAGGQTALGRGDDFCQHAEEGAAGFGRAVFEPGGVELKGCAIGIEETQPGIWVREQRGRDQTNAVTHADEREHAVNRRSHAAELGGEERRVTKLSDERPIARMVFLIEFDPSFIFQLAHLDRARRGESVPDGDDRFQIGGAKRQGLQIGAPFDAGFVNEREVDAPVPQGVDLRVDRKLDEVDGDLRMFGPIMEHGFGNLRHQDSPVASQIEFAAGAAGDLLRARDGEGELGEQAVHFALKMAAGVGQPHARGGANEKLQIQFLFERGDLPTDRGLGDVKAFGRPTEAQGFGDDLKIA